jgi:hypothetical protein
MVEPGLGRVVGLGQGAGSALSMIWRGVFSCSSDSKACISGAEENQRRGASSHSTLHSATSDMPWWCAMKVLTRLSACAPGWRATVKSSASAKPYSPRAPHCSSWRRLAAASLRHELGRHDAGIGRDHAVGGRRAAQGQARHAEGRVLVGQRVVLREIGRFRDAPGQALRSP